ncbi:MAG: zinc ABC transporter substrate-binding protein [Nakamurella sp.]
MRFEFRPLILAAGLSTVLLGLAACSSASGAESGSSSAGAGAPITVVTSTNVWGDIVEQVGGDLVAVTSVISDPSADPHSYEANAQTQLALSKAQLVVENGGGYDDFMQSMLEASTASDATVLNAVEISGKTATAGDELNEHVWYDFPTVNKVAAQVATELGAIDPANAAAFTANAAAFSSKLDGLSAKVETIKDSHAGTPIAITEPVPLYLTDAAGLVNKTPAEFSEAIEAGTDVPPTVLSDTLALFTAHQVAALVYNEQTASPETEKLLAAAKDNSIADVGVAETVPTGKDYVSWMDSNITALATALGG